MLKGEGVSHTLFNLAPCGINPPHTHPRATEILFVIDADVLQVKCRYLFYHIKISCTLTKSKQYCLYITDPLFNKSVFNLNTLLDILKNRFLIAYRK